MYKVYKVCADAGYRYSPNAVSSSEFCTTSSSYYYDDRDYSATPSSSTIGNHDDDVTAPELDRCVVSRQMSLKTFRLEFKEKTFKMCDEISVIIIIIRAFVRRTMSASELYYKNVCKR